MKKPLSSGVQTIIMLQNICFVLLVAQDNGTSDW
jgi:hypothetical protein